MLFLLFIGLWVSNQPIYADTDVLNQFSQDKPAPNIPVIENLRPEESPSDEALTVDYDFQEKPYILKGSIESFDPVLRAKELAKTIPRKWCGTFSYFGKDHIYDVVLNFSEAIPIGQIITLKGGLNLDNSNIPLFGHLNVKSNQLELLPISDKSVSGLEPGSIFMGLHDSGILSWKSSRLNNAGGKLILKKICDS